MAANDLVTVNQVERHLGMPLDSGDATQLGLQIEVASQLIEDFLGRKLISQTHIQYFDGRRTDRLILREWPVSALTEIRVDSDHLFTSDDTILASTAYVLVNDQEVIKIDDGNWNYGKYSIKVTYVAGWLQAAIPATIRNACLQLVEYLEAKRTYRDIDKESKSKGGETIKLVQGIPEIIAMQLEPYQRMQFAMGEVMAQNG